jgi:hypothetical protein
MHATPYTLTGALLGAALAALVGWRLGGSAGAGIALGYLYGATLCALGLAWQIHWLRRRPARALRALAESMLVKLFALLGAALAIRYLAPVAERVDWRSFLIAFAAAVALVLVPGSLDLSRNAKSAKAPRAS